MSRYLVDRIDAHPRVNVQANTTIIAVDGDQTVRSVRIKNLDGEAVLDCCALFSFIGADPGSGWLSGCAALDERGFVLTDRSLDEAVLDGRWQILGRAPLPYETSHPGLFAVGDVRAGSTKRVATAVGEGSAAVRAVHEYLAFAH
jgi:thioredoxin reductase (NADPH)